MRYFIELSYNGSAYHGWQIQPDAISVQEVLEKALSTLLRTPISIMGAGRTDTGVHAKQMFAHFDFEATLNDPNFVFKLNSFLPKDVAVQAIFQVKDDVHARFHAISRTYLYRVSLQKDVFNNESAYYVKHSLDVDKMKAAAKILFEYNDFQCFSKSKTEVKTFLCTIMKADWQLVENELQFTIKADRFLRNMVRAIVGTIINIGLGKIPVDQLHHIIKSKNRSEAGFSVPAHGLYLINVEYPQDIII
ncbi:tRNA pseudouridine(38-40) synthase TruA [Algibacter miyuki]|uniref:tRNA pseudouridine synthase A n=1 Tax=Algibacter miyuki TaxID=1306933 RepID=A0ABV5H3Z2_9FLAO|nr:tRNA pseudouridine(38-40) synthase TruA [Algibacter miyuki]MDN3664202.1 tRNA pseudouridine(38-40) synthase TruA [Algibacter miyuki]MDN3665662.1 tRNA pseudouridine(38-40) synthase TruA [Algibacter miyuki]MDN3667680.1 tRNA pseudouridine(38-40) synthase TruA [Algibacter miyuki]MDN3667681.1 tRNA pseudouridine(38-40) synthase TruA [Algibacter miyuki]